MTVRGAVIHDVNGRYSVENLELTEPQDGEVLIKVMASGLCHSDEHVRTGDAGLELPFVMGHEGAGVVEAVGPGVTRVQPGDRVATAFIPACGHCDWCSRGMQYICDNGGGVGTGRRDDGSARFTLSDGRPAGAMQRLGTLANWLVTGEEQCAKIEDGLPFEQACLVSCAVSTGWGSAVNTADVAAGDVVVIVGTGGVGINAVQGAAMAGASRVVAVDVVQQKVDTALKVGATDGFTSLEEAMPLVRDLTNGQGADSVIITAGWVDGDLIGTGFSATRKGGTCVVTGVGQNSPGIAINPWELTIFAKNLRGTLFGSCNPTRDIPRIVRYAKGGQLNLGAIVTRTYSLDQINDAADDLHAGRNIRGVILHEH